jgi:hypothetical protein
VVGLEVEADFDARGAGVLEGVGDGFEGDADTLDLVPGSEDPRFGHEF